ncbi:MAG: NAD(P)H-binding protein [Planctomycetota bacterium]
MASETVVVTGATGNIGSELVKKLLAAGKNVRAVGRSKDKLAALGKVDPRTGSTDDRNFLTDAFRGATAVFAMIPPNHQAQDTRAEQKKQGEALTAALRDSGVSRVVTLSSVGADRPDKTGPIVGLHDFEKSVDRLQGLKVVHLRPAYFMENLLGTVGLIKSAGINGSALKGDVAISMVATKDIAQVAFDELTTPRREARAIRYVLGPRDYTMSEATKILGAAIGKPDLHYVTFPEPEFKAGLIGHGFPAKLAEMFAEMLGAFNAGLIKTDARAATNTTPTTLEDFAKSTFAPSYSAS